MRFIRKYLSLLVPVLIVFVAIVLFVPTFLTGKSISKDMETSIADGKKITSLLKKTPCVAQAEVEKLYQIEHKKDADEIVQLARQSNLRELVSYNIFPKPQDTSQQVFVQFGARYRTKIEELIKSMNALDAPRDIDIRKEIEGNSSVPSGMGRGRLGGFGSIRMSGSKTGASNAIIDAVCNKRAESVLVYANPNVFAWYGYWGSYKYSGSEKSIKSCWHCQVAYWVYEDVVSTIAVMNSGSDCVYNSSVKRLVGVSFTRPVGYVDSKLGMGMGTSTSASFTDAPGYVLAKGVTILGSEPWTGRICDNDIDVIHFAVSVIVDSKSFMPFIKELCREKEHLHREGYSENGAEKIYKHNQITVLMSKIKPVDRKAKEHEYYRYGDGAVVQLDLTCEYIFHRSSYDQIKPEPIKVLLGQSKAVKGAAAGGKF
ncbi:MAG: hypothetical protein ACYTFK_04145 [Planctomycetota bacterium]|jgi:hypothetical protein